MPGGNSVSLPSDFLDDLVRLHAPHLLAPPSGAPPPAVPGLAPSAPAAAPDTLPVNQSPSLAPPSRAESESAGKAEFQAGKPTVTAEAGSPGYYKQRIDQADYATAHPWGSPISEHPGFLGKVAHGLAKAGNIAGDIFAPEVLQNIPGTDLNRQAQRASDQAHLLPAEEEARKQQETNQRPDIAEAAGEAKGRLETQKEADADKRQQNALDSQETRAEAARKEQEAGRTHSDQQLDKRLTASDRAQGEREDAAEHRTQELIASQQGKKSAAESAQVERESRGAIRKAGEAYRDASEKEASMNDFIQAAKGGNKAAYANVPLEGALDITTSQGTKRINRTEVEQYAGAGSLFDRISGEVGKLTKGASIPNNVLDDMNQLSKILGTNAYKKYSDTYDDEAGIVHGYGGQDFDKRVPKIQRGGAGAAAPVDTTGGIQVIRDANGRIVGVK